MEPSSEPSADRARLKTLLGTTRAQPKRNPLPALHTPTLTPSASAPRTQPSAAMEFVANLDQIRIMDTRTSVRDGATLYVVQAYTLYQSCSHLPTARTSSTLPAPPTPIRQPVLSLGSRTSTATPTTASTSEHHDAPSALPTSACVVGSPSLHGSVTMP